MGVIMSAECSCGYSASNETDKTGSNFPRGNGLFGRVKLGYEMQIQDVLYYPVLCRLCREVLSIDLQQRPLRCPVCRGTNVVPYYWPQMVDRKGRIQIPCSMVSAGAEPGQRPKYALYEDAEYLCPRCGSKHLRFKFEGLRD